MGEHHSVFIQDHGLHIRIKYRLSDHVIEDRFRTADQKHSQTPGGIFFVYGFKEADHCFVIDRAAQSAVQDIIFVQQNPPAVPYFISFIDKL